MSDRGWKAYERRIARLLGTQRIPVTGERAGADLETPLLAVQAKKRATVPGYWFEWLDGIRVAAARRNKIGVVVMQRPYGVELDSLVVLSLRDWIELHSPARDGQRPPDVRAVPTGSPAACRSASACCRSPLRRVRDRSDTTSLMRRV